jgi:hypothetical protein
MNQTTAACLSGTRTQSGSRSGIILILAVFAFFAFGADGVSGPLHKVRVKDRAQAQQLIERGGKLVADYGSFQIILTEESVAGTKLRGRNEADDAADFIELNAQRINTRSPEARAMRKARGSVAGQQLHLVQFVGPVKPEWRETLEGLGVKAINYIPENAYLVSGDAKALAALSDWATNVDFVQWEGEYLPEFKIHPAARQRESFGLAAPANESNVFAVQIIEDAEATPTTLALIESLKLEAVQRDFRVLQYRNLIVRLPADRLGEISARPDVLSIQPYNEPGKRDERQAQIMAGNLMGGSLTGPGYLDWLMEKGFTQAQFDASGFVVDVTDSGIDNGTTAPGHFGLYAHADFGQSSRVAYNRLVGTAHAGSTLAGLDGHGNLNAHILAGYGDFTGGFPQVDSGGYQSGLGVCPFVRVGSSVVFDPDLFTSPNYADLQSRAYQDGARISANSWGATNNTYTLDAQAFDALVRDAQPDGANFAAPGNQEMVILFAAGNRGSLANTVGAPGTAKNVITVGASENMRSLNTASGGKSSMGSDGCGYADTAADSANDVAAFSSRGPCSDGRQKPDLVAPGTHVVGGVPQSVATWAGNGSALAGFKASSICALSGGGTAGSTNNFFPLGQQFYTVSSGTSHATPAAAGACALLRQHFLNANLAAPSPAMTKAFLMNSTRYLSGSGAGDNLWSPSQGMGAVNLGRAFDGVPRVLRDQHAEDLLTASGQTRVFTAHMVQTNEPLRVTLAWTDAPGSTMGSAFNNDLDLTVQVGTNVYLGNVFSGASSALGGSADNRNNVESVLLPAGISGDIVVIVTAANINSDGVPNFGGSLDQDFALVVYNATNTTVPVIAPTGTALLEEGFSPLNGAVDPGELVSVGLSLKNTGTRSATNLQVTLLAANGVSAPSGLASFGTLTNDGAPVSRTFSFIANGVAGAVIHPAFQLTDATGDLGVVSVEVLLGLRTIQTRSFTNATALTIPDSGAASVYPSLIVVAEVPGAIQKVTATLRGFSHDWPDDVDVLLAGPSGTNVMLLSDCGGGNSRNSINLTFDDTAVASIPDSAAIGAEAYKPTNMDTTTDNLPSPAPVGTFGKTLGVFNGWNPNGNWSLYIRDDNAMDGGSVTQGWTLSLTTSNLSYVTGASNAADLAVTTVISTNAIFARSSFSLTLTVTNAGPDAATFVSLTNNFPAGFVLQAAACPVGSWSWAGASGLWSIGKLDAGSSAILTFTGKCLLGGNYFNSCSVAGFTSDPNDGNNSATIALVVLNGGSGLTLITNTAPLLALLPDRVVHAGARLNFTVVATDADIPTNTLAFELLAGAPMGATIDPGSGEFLWQTTDADVATTNTISVRVTDNGSPVLADTRSFAVTVVDRPLLTGITVHDNVVSVSWGTVPGQAYRLQFASDLRSGIWEAAVPDIVATGETATHTNAIGTNLMQFYRVLVLP